MVGHHTYKFTIQNILRIFYDGCDPKLLTSIHKNGGKKWSILMTPPCGVNHCTTFSQNMFIPFPPRDIMLCHHLSRSIVTYKHPMAWAIFWGCQKNAHAIGCDNSTMIKTGAGPLQRFPWICCWKAKNVFKYTKTTCAIVFQVTFNMGTAK